MQKNGKGFLRILQRYIDRSSPVKEKRLMDTWYDSIDNGVQDNSNELPGSQQEQKLWNKIHGAILSQGPAPVSTGKKWWEGSLMKLASAASVIFVLGFLYYNSGNRKSSVFPIENMSKEHLASLTETVNTSSDKMVVRLHDGSRVTLEPNAKLYYPQSFDAGQRIVYLVGNGFFDIAKNPEKPFLVYSENIVTKVLGTSFTIHKNDKTGDMEVAVMTGKVIVELAKDGNTDFDVNTNGVVLTPNKKVLYLHDAGTYVTSLVEKPAMVETGGEFEKPDAFTFEETPLSEVVEKLEKAYGVEVKVTNESILNCPITADLPKESLFAKIEVINALLNTKSVVEGTAIVLTGGDCTPFKSVNP